MMEWILIGVGMLIVAILGDRMLARRKHVPLSHTRPNVVEPDVKLGQEATDLKLMDKVNAQNRRLNAQNGANRGRGGNMNDIVPRLKTKPRQKDGPAK